MQHHTDSHPRTDIRGAGGQKAESIVERIGHTLLDQVINVIDSFPSGLQVQTAVDDLNAQVILFIDQDAESFIGIDQYASRTVRFRQLAADQLPLHEELAIESR